MKKFYIVLTIILVAIPIAGTLWLIYSPTAQPFIIWWVRHEGSYMDMLSLYIGMVAFGFSVAALVNAIRL